MIFSQPLSMIKKISGILVILLISTQIATAQRGKMRIAYIDMEMILDSMPEYQQALKELDLRVQQWKMKLDKMQREITRLKKELDAERLMLTKDLVNEKQEIIDFKQKQMEKFQMEKFGPQGDLVIQKMMIVKPVQDKVFNAVKKIVATRHYDIVFDKSNPDMGIIHVNPKMNITSQVLRILRKEKMKEEREKRRKNRNKRHAKKDTKESLRKKYEERRRRLREQRKRQEEMKKKQQEEARKKETEQKEKKENNN